MEETRNHVADLEADMRVDLENASRYAGQAWIRAQNLWGRTSPETQAIDDAWQALARLSDAYPTEAALRLRDRALR